MLLSVLSGVGLWMSKSQPFLIIELLPMITGTSCKYGYLPTCSSGGYHVVLLFVLFISIILLFIFIFFLISKGPTMYLIRNRFVFNYTFKGHVW